MIFRARYVVPVDSPAIEDGGFSVKAGRIAEVGRFGDLEGTSRQTSDGYVDFGDAVILPGLVNAHTHLELSDLGGLVRPSHKFTDWLRSLFNILAGSDRNEDVVVAATREGIRQSIRAGVTMVGDITRYPGWTRSVLAPSGLRGVSYGEIAAIGRRRYLLAERLRAAREAHQPGAMNMRIGISPHAPYTVEPAALRTCLEAAGSERLPVCMHMAEVVDEDEFTTALTGSLAEYLRGLGLWDEGVEAHEYRAIELLERYDFPRGRTLFAHVNYARDEDIERLIRHGVSVAYCPRTHAAFGHPPHRFREMLSAGVNVCLGTDSLASNPSLSILDELRFVHRKNPEVSGEMVVAMGTLHGARALGMEKVGGSLGVGKLADFVVVPLESGERGWNSVLETMLSPSHVFIGGVERT